MSGLQSHILNESIGESREIKEYNALLRRKSKMSLEKTLKLFKETHNDLYDYSKFILIDQNTKSIIICKKHGEFLQAPRNHKRGKGCPTCNKGGSGLQNEVIERFKKVHNETYDYSKVKYKNYNTPVEIICREHGSFFQKPFNHYRGNGCLKCSIINKRLGINERIEQFNNIHNSKYSYPNIEKEYINTLTKISIKCPVESHGIFYQLPVNHYAGSGCPKCYTNKIEEYLLNFLISLNIKVENHNRKMIEPLEIDFLVPDFKFGIEHNGLFWHSYGISSFEIMNNSKAIKKNKHLEKTIKMEEQGYQLFHIREDHMVGKKNKKEIWKSVIMNKCGLSNKIHARKLQVINLNDYKDFVKEFLGDNHLQGSCPSSIKLGLQDPETGNIYSIMTFGKSRYNKNIEYELLRFCNLRYHNVRGAASKLLKFFERTYKPNSLISYANRDWSQGNLYKTLGFEYSHSSEPNYFYVDGMDIIPRQQVQKHKLKEFLEIRTKTFDENLSERDNMINNGYRIYYDTGNLVYHKYYTKDN